MRVANGSPLTGSVICVWNETPTGSAGAGAQAPAWKRQQAVGYDGDYAAWILKGS